MNPPIKFKLYSENNKGEKKRLFMGNLTYQNREKIINIIRESIQWACEFGDNIDIIIKHSDGIIEEDEKEVY